MIKLIQFGENILDRILTLRKPRMPFNAEFGNEGESLSMSHRGFQINGRARISLMESYKNALVVGGTGSGKSRKSLIPTIKNLNTSMIIHDPSGELLNATGRILQSQGFTIKVFNPSNAGKSCGFNPFTLVKKAGDARKLAKVLIRVSNSDSQDSFWSNSAESLLGMLIECVLKQSVEYQNLTNVLGLLDGLSSDPSAIEMLFKNVEDECLWEAYLSFMNSDEKLRSSIVATARTTLSSFYDESVQRTTSNKSIDLAVLRKFKTAIFLQTSTIDSIHLAPIQSLFVEVALDCILSELPTENEGDVFFILDEASSLTCPALPLAMANVRKYRCGIMLAVQDVRQLHERYGPNGTSAILSNAYAKLFFSNISLETADYIERMIGKSSKQYPEFGRKPLVEAAAIRQLPSDRAILFIGNARPLLTKTLSFKKAFKYPDVKKVHFDNRTLEKPRLVHKSTVGNALA